MISFSKYAYDLDYQNADGKFYVMQMMSNGLTYVA